VVFSIRPGNKTTEHAVENTEFTSAEKSTHVSVAGQDHACVFLRQQGVSSLWIHCTRTNGKSTVLFGSADKVTGICSEERPGLWPDKWILHHDIASAHEALRFREFLAKNSITKMEHPPYSPDLAPFRFLALSKIKKVLKGQRFADPSDIQRNVKILLRDSPENYFQDFPTVAPSSHGEVHSFTRRVFRRRQQPLGHR